MRVWGLAARASGSGFGVEAQRLQNPLIKEYTLNHIRDPTVI